MLVRPSFLTCRSEANTLGLVVLCTCFISFFMRLGAAPLVDLDEGAFTQATLEMLARGDWVSPYLGGAPRFDKPALIHWLQAGSVLVFGTNETAFRLPSAVAATLWVLITWRFAHRRFGPHAATVAAVALATSPLVIVIGRAATADAVLNLCIAATCFALFDYLQEHKRRDLRLAAAFAAIGFLTKGPVAVVIPGMALLAWALWRGELLQRLRSVCDPVAIILFAIIAAPWYVLQYHRQGQAFIDGFFLHHNLDRLLSPAFGHNAPWWFYLALLPLATLAFIPLACRVIATTGKSLGNGAEAFLVGWFITVLVFFSLSGSKLPHYLLYGFTGFCVLIGTRALEIRTRWAMVPTIGASALLAATGMIAAIAAGHATNPYARELLERLATDLHPAGLGYFAAVAVIACGWFIRPLVNVPIALASGGIAIALGLGALLIPTALSIQQDPIREAARFTALHDLHPVMWGINAPSLMVYSGRIVERRPPEPCGAVITRRALLGDLGPHEVLFERGPIALAALECATSP